MTPRIPRTLRSRLTILGVGAVAVWVVALTAAFNVVLARQLDAQASSVLRTRAEAVAATIAVENGQVVLREPAADDALDEGVWIYAGTRLLEQPPHAPQTLDRLAARLAGAGPRFLERDGLRGARLYALPVRVDGRPVATVVVSTSLTPYVRAERVALLASLALGALFVLGIWPAVRFTVGRALAPVHAMTRQAADWSEHDLGRRFGVAARPQELDDLAHTLDSVLDRLAAVVRHEQQLSGELSHELRTPLARIAAETDLLLSRERSPAEQRAAYASIADSTEHLRSILETLLTAARAAVAAAPGRCDVAVVVAGALARLSDASCAVRSDIPPSTVAGVDAAVLDRLLAPLLDNAIRYADSCVTVRARTAEGSVLLEVADDGPGIPAQARTSVFLPGTRGNPEDGHDGAGLGLALARRLTVAADGEIEAAADVSSGGAVLRVRLPAG